MVGQRLVVSAWRDDSFRKKRLKRRSSLWGGTSTARGCRAWVTNMNLTPAGVWHFYDGRAGMEPRIGALREDFALRKIPTASFAANALYLEIDRLAYNLVTVFERNCLDTHQTALQTIFAPRRIDSTAEQTYAAPAPLPRTWLTRLILLPLEAAPTSTRMVAGVLAPVGTVCAVAASAIASRMMVPCVPHFAPMFGGFTVLTPGM